MMHNVVNDGTAAGVLPSSLQRSPARPERRRSAPAARCSLPNQPWFIGFAPADDPKIAVAATIERSSSFGGRGRGADRDAR